MSHPTLPTRPVGSNETTLRDKFAESVAGQSDLMDKLGQQLITLELAIPGLYATVLKFTRGDAATAARNQWLYLAFGCWFLALVLTLASLVPRHWRVDPTILRQDPEQNPGQKSEVLGLEDFFYKSARYKCWLIIPACVLFLLGVLAAALLVL